MGAPEARVRLKGDRLQLEWPGRAACTGLAVRCRLRHGGLHESARWAKTRSARIGYVTSCGPLSIQLRLQLESGLVRLGVEVCAEADVDVAQVALVTRSELEGTGPTWVITNGYQSWDPSGHLPANGSRESWWTIGLATADGGGIAAVAAGARSGCTQFTLEGGVLSVVWREAQALESWPSLFAGPSGRRWTSDELMLCSGPDVQGALRRLTGATNGSTGTVRPVTAPLGWLSWYQYGPWIRREDVLANARLLAGEECRRLGYRLIQVDDGWQEAYGEWVTNTKFPGGLRVLAAELSQHGQVTGVWTAPFLVSAAAKLAFEAPDEWFVMDPETGERAIDPRQRVFGPMYVLDASRLEVQEHLRELFSGIYAAGARYFKIDFLYAGAYAGMEALRAGVRAIREGVRDAYLLACGAPLLPVVGLVDGCRIGGDTATPVYDFDEGISRPTIFDNEVIAVARNAAARHFLDGWFQLDPDVALVGGYLSLEQARQLVTVAALTGGPFFASDDLTSLPPERLALLTNPEVLELVGGGPAVPDWEPEADDCPATHWRRADVLAVFNWGGESRGIAVRAPGAAGARDLWAREDLPALRDGTRLAVPASGVRLLRLR